MAKFKFGKDPAGNAKGRAMLFFFVVVILTGLAVGYLIYRKHHETSLKAGVGLSNAPGIQSIPGVGKTSTEYIKLQQEQNIREAQIAAQKGTASVPTITRASFFGPSEFSTAKGTTTIPGCSPDELRRARAAGVTAEELRCKGCSLAELKAAGYTAGDLAAAGFSPSELKNAGFTAAELRQAGFTPGELKQAGFNAAQLARAGFSPAEVAQAGFSNNDIKNGGFNPNDLLAAGIGAAKPANLPTDCNIDSLRKAKAQGIPAAALKKLGCGAGALRVAGYTAADLRAAGFTPEELKAAGFSPQELRAAGFTAGQLRRAGFSANDLKNAGFSAADLKNAGFSAAALKNAGFSPDDLRNAGYTNGDLLRAGFNPSDVMPQAVAGMAAAADQCSVDALRQARAQGVSAAEIKKRGCSTAAMLAAGYTPAELKAAGSSDADLAAAGLTPAQIAAAGGAVPGVLGTAPGGGAAGIAGNAVIPSVGNTELQLSQLQANQEQQLNDQQKQQRATQTQSSMISQANSLFSTWTPPATQVFVEGEPPLKEQPKEQPKGQQVAAVPGATTLTTTTSAGAVSTTTAVPVSPGLATGRGCAYVKAGDVMMAVLTSTVNSDENSPVMATIVSGKLRGAKLMGQFTLLKKKVLINFNKMNIPGKPESIGMNAVAIDPQTAHTALADCVNSHYWLRYGTLFASSFLSGLADAISQQGSQTSTGSGGILVTHDPLSTGQTIAVALGAVGSQYASVLGSNFTRPPTVYVYAGDSIGVLFMQDLGDDSVPATCCPDIDKTCNGLGGAGAMGTCIGATY